MRHALCAGLQPISRRESPALPGCACNSLALPRVTVNTKAVNDAIDGPGLRQLWPVAKEARPESART